MNVEYGLVAGYLFAWGVNRAKAAGGAVGAITDKTLQAALTRLETVVRNRLGTANEAIEDLDEETAAAVAAPADSSGATPALSEGTHDALVRSLQRAVRKTPDFATDLAEALTAVQAADPAAAATGGVSSTGGGTTAGGNVTINAHGPGSVAVGGNTGDVTLAPPTPGTGAPSGGTPADPHTPGPRQS
ncbi:hypothetical protein [Streptomyces bohaiensis]|uniref:hypothetical protein n=1 Tax=Streptomyces bohaiensis TaxID=1431344 RepID=UPI003B7D72F5